MDEILLLYICEECENEFYFSPDQLPGGEEHCEFCEECHGRLLPFDAYLAESGELVIYSEPEE